MCDLAREFFLGHPVHALQTDLLRMKIKGIEMKLKVQRNLYT